MLQPLFILVISGTDTIKHPGISAAGASQELLPYTAALDAEFIYHGYTKTLDKLPVSPNHIVSPALISKACLNILNIPLVIIDAGTHIKPQCPFIQVRKQVSADTSSGEAMSIADTHELFQTGKELAEEFKGFDELIIAECVVGGTTTAFGLLSGLGYDCSNMISSSFPNGNHALKETLVKQGLAKAQINKSDPLSAVAALGDPMQALVAGLALGSQAKITLAGGTQMLAVGALVQRIIEKEVSILDTSLRGAQRRSNLNDIQIITTQWVIKDKSAQFTELHQLCCPQINVKHSSIDSSCARHRLKNEIQKLSNTDLEQILDRYDEGHVKEGVGMGALLDLLSQSKISASPLPF